MPVEFRPKPSKGLRKNFQKNPKKRTQYYARKSRVLPEQGSPGIIASGQKALDIRRNIRNTINRKLKRFPKPIVDVCMELNEAIYTIRRDDALEYESVSQKSKPGRVVFTNLYTAGRKGDTGAVRKISKIYFQALEILKHKIRDGKIRLVSMDELIRTADIKSIFLKDNFDFM